MSLAAVGFLTQNMVVLLVALFCTGLQSTLFGPVKYSILPSVLKPEELTGGNGLVEMGTSISILIGMIFGGLIFTARRRRTGRSWPRPRSSLLAITGNLVSRAIPRAEAGAPDLKINWNPIPESLADLAPGASKQPAVRNAILGVSWFWFIGTVLTSQLPTYAEVNLGGERARCTSSRWRCSRSAPASVRCCARSCRHARSRSAWCRWARSASARSCSTCTSRAAARAPAHGLTIARLPAAARQLAHRDRPGRHRPVRRLLRRAAVRADPEPHAEATSSRA